MAVLKVLATSAVADNKFEAAFLNLRLFSFRIYLENQKSITLTRKIRFLS